MLEMSFDAFRREIESAERFRNQHTHAMREMVQRYHGPMYRADRDDPSIDDPENFAHEYISLVLPRIIHDNPRFRVRMGTLAAELLYGKKLTIALNRWSRIVKLRRTLERIATDMLIGHGVALTTSEPRGEKRKADAKHSYLPRVYRLSPERFFMDTAATHVEDARYMGHCYAIDKDDLLARAKGDPTWDIDAIEAIGAGTDLEEARDEDDREIEWRKELAVYEVWVPEFHMPAEIIDTALDENMVNGTILTMVKGVNGATKWDGFIRAPMPYIGPSKGPYTVFGVYTIPDDPYPMSPLVAVASQTEDLNAHLTSVRSSAAAYKRLVMVDSRNAKLAQDIKDKPHDYVLLSENLDKERVINLEVGGITPQQVQYSQMAQDRLDRVSGIHDAMRGNITGTATATEVAVAESSATMRMAHLKRQFQDCVDDLARSVVWHMWHDDRIAFPLGREGARAILQADATFVGGTVNGEFEDLEVSVDAYSMERVSEAIVQKRAMELLQITTSVAQGMMTLPNVKWGELLNVVGDALNIPNLSEMVDTGQGGDAPPMPQQGMPMPQGGGDQRMNAMGEPNPIPASSLGGLAAAAGGVR
jgi:hypothetical protein